MFSPELGVPGVVEVPALKIETEAERLLELVDGHVPDLRGSGRGGCGGGCRREGRGCLLLRCRWLVLLLLGVDGRQSRGKGE